MIEARDPDAYTRRITEFMTRWPYRFILPAESEETAEAGMAWMERGEVITFSRPDIDAWLAEFVNPGRFARLLDMVGFDEGDVAFAFKIRFWEPA